MIEFIRAGGWLMIPIILSSVIAMAIIIERFLSLRTGKVMPAADIKRARELAAAGNVAQGEIDSLSQSSVVGRLLSTGLANSTAPRHILKENLEEAGRHVVHRLERYMTALGTIAAITPLMGLLGTVLGMITAFSKITQVGVGDPATVAGGISQALFTTAAGISVAIVALIFHRYFKAKVDNYVVGMEQEAIKLIEIVNNSQSRRSASAARSPVAPMNGGNGGNGSSSNNNGSNNNNNGHTGNSKAKSATVAASRRQRATAGGQV